MKLVNKVVNRAIKKGWKNTEVRGIPPGEWTEAEISHVIFSHDFAKALWGEKDHEARGLVFANFANWKYHLTKLVLEEKRLEYILKNTKT